jgi:hypothetical protein
MTTQLLLYNGALRALGERKLASLTEETKARRTLDDVWTAGAVNAVLEQGFWNFATRTAKFTPDVGFTASFGYRNKFSKPSDFIRLTAMCQDEYFSAPLNGYVDEAGAWYSDAPEIYVMYVSNAPTYGADLTRWPESFSDYVELYLADEVAGALTADADRVKEKLRRALTNAKSKDAMNEPTKFMPPGRFTQTRQGSRSRGDRGNRGSLIG